MGVVVTYIGISCVIAALDIIIAYMAYRAYQRKNKEGKYLCITCVFAAIVDISYLLSILSKDLMFVTYSSGIYFFSIDLMLNFLLIFVLLYARMMSDRWKKIFFPLSFVFTIYEIVHFLVNPLTGTMIGYHEQGKLLAHYAYDLKLPYDIHLLYTYFLVALVVAVLAIKSVRVAREYRKQYLYQILVIVLIVAINAVFLFMPDMGLVSELDLSICGYSVAAVIMYWSCFQYTKKGMLNEFKYSIFESIDQGLVLFDYNDKLVLFNGKAAHFLKGVELSTNTSLQELLDSCEIKLTPEIENGRYSLQCYMKIQNERIPLRCDYRKLFNKDGKVLGRLFVFSDMGSDTDLLTGFHRWNSFRRMVRDGMIDGSSPLVVATCDINGLSVINTTKGRSKGDEMIRELADLLRRHFSAESYYVRGYEAHLMVLCYTKDAKTVRSIMDDIRGEFSGYMQYAISEVNGMQPDILLAMDQAGKALKTKKLLDKDATHSAVMTSLIGALKECDVDTEAHVNRTKILGHELGRRIGLSDMELSELELLCVLHDIGKIGIPLEILNKPGKLSHEEWIMMQSHVEKGYQIAKSSPELLDIADMIRHHHECWDGTGYPDGISRETIPLLSRLICVVDAYDAMVSDRPYRKALTEEAARKELRRCAGTQFDPALVSEFLQMLEDPMIEGMLRQSPGVKQRLLSDNIDDKLAEDESETVHSSNVFSVPYTTYIVDAQNYILEVDDAFEALTGYSREDVKERHLQQLDLIPKTDHTEYLCRVNEEQSHHQLIYLEHRLVRSDGIELNVFCMGRTYFDSAAKSPHVEITVAKSSDTHLSKMIQEREQGKALARLEQWENTYRRDSMTGLLRHAAFKNDVELVLLNEEHYKIMMLMMDVDKFKEYNDTYGHRAGDEFLVLLSQTLVSALRKEDLACRMGGDEFSAALFFKEDTAFELMQNRARQIFERIRISLSALSQTTSISMGVAISGETLNTFNKLYEAADIALYDSKKEGRDCLSFYHK